MSTDRPLEIEFPVMRYDITLPLLEGRVAVDGVKLKPVKSSSMINKPEPKLQAGDFGLMDLNIGYLLPAIEAGWEIIGLPVFSKRKPVYQLIFCHADAAIRAPQDLAGKRIGSRAPIARRLPFGRAAFCASVTALISRRCAGFSKPRKFFPCMTPSRTSTMSTIARTCPSA